jgi:predicted Fe-Mo cluster-binding NifX family protein
MSKIVIPVKDDLLSRSFNACKYFLIYEIRDEKVVSKKIELFPNEFRSSISRWSEALGITEVIVHSIDETSLAVLTSMKLNIFVGVKISPPDHLVEQLLSGTLKSDTHHIIEKCGLA